MATIITKNSSTASSVPAAGSLQQGELAVNVTDKKLYTKDSSAAVVKLVGSLGNQETNAVAITGGTINGTAIGGTTPSSAAFTTASASGGFTGNLTGNASTVTNGVYTTGSYADPSWITSLAGSKITGNISGNAGNVTGTVAIANGGTGLTALGTGVQTALGQAVTGSGGIVLANSPSLVTPNLGTPSAATLTNATGLPVSTGIAGLGTNVATALGVSVGSAGAFVVNGGALGTPSSGTVTNLTGTASININGTVGATTPSTGSFTTLTTSSTVTINGGTANGVAYLNGSKVLTTGSALTFDGSMLNTKGQFRVTDSTNAANYLLFGSGANAPRGGNSITAQTSTFVFGTETDNPNIFIVNGSEQMRLTSTGLGIGTSSPGSKLQVAGAIRFGSNASFYGSIDHDAVTTGANIYNSQDTGGHLFQNSGSTVLTLNNSGNLGLGVTPSGWNSVYRSMQLGKGASISGRSDENTWNELLSNAYRASDASWKYLNTDYALSYRMAAGAHQWYVAASGTAGAPISFTPVMTLTAAGELLVGTTTQLSGSTSRAVVDYASADYTLRVNNSNAVPLTMLMTFSGASPNNTSSAFIYCNDSGPTQRFSVRGNGGVYNYQANDSNLSDRREKTNFAPAKSYLDTICAIPVQTFNYIDQNLEEDPGLTLGVVAQDVQAVAPELVKESNWGTEDNPRVRLSLYQTDLQYALMKCIQELKAELDTVKAELATLKGA